VRKRQTESGGQPRFAKEEELREAITAVFLLSVVLGCGSREAAKKVKPITDQTLVIDVRTDLEFKSGPFRVRSIYRTMRWESE